MFSQPTSTVAKSTVFQHTYYDRRKNFIEFSEKCHLRNTEAPPRQKRARTSVTNSSILGHNQTAKGLINSAEIIKHFRKRYISWSRASWCWLVHIRFLRCRLFFCGADQLSGNSVDNIYLYVVDREIYSIQSNFQFRAVGYTQLLKYFLHACIVRTKPVC